jgi:hypothetical protein
MEPALSAIQKKKKALKRGENFAFLLLGINILLLLYIQT